MDFLHFSDEPFADEASAEAVFQVGVDLISHLGDDASGGCIEAHLTGLPDGVCEGFLTVHMFSPLHGFDGSVGVHVVRD